MPFNPPTYKPGDLIRAEDENARNEEVKRLGGVRSSGGIESRSGAGGLQVSGSLPEVIFLKLTGPAGANTSYPWIEVYHQKPNTWIPGNRSGSPDNDPAYPASGDATLTADGKVWEARRAPTSAEWIFD